MGGETEGYGDGRIKVGIGQMEDHITMTPPFVPEKILRVWIYYFEFRPTEGAVRREFKYYIQSPEKPTYHQLRGSVSK